VTSKVKTVESAGTVVVSGNITHVVVVHLDAPASDGTLTGTVAGILC
jgi:hypothetical protein